jgi:hypothetical protein
MLRLALCAIFTTVVVKQKGCCLYVVRFYPTRYRTHPQ